MVGFFRRVFRTSSAVWDLTWVAVRSARLQSGARQSAGPGRSLQGNNAELARTVQPRRRVAGQREPVTDPVPTLAEVLGEAHQEDGAG